MIRPAALDTGGLVGWGVSVQLISSLGACGLVAARLTALGARVAVQSELNPVLTRLLDAPCGVDMLVIDCDHAGGIATGLQAFKRLTAGGVWLPVVLISAACTEQTFPIGREAPIHLRSPPSVVALRIGFELAFPVTQAPALKKGRSQRGAPFRI